MLVSSQKERGWPYMSIVNICKRAISNWFMSSSGLRNQGGHFQKYAVEKIGIFLWMYIIDTFNCWFEKRSIKKFLHLQIAVLHTKAHRSFVFSWYVIIWDKNKPWPICSLKILCSPCCSYNILCRSVQLGKKKKRPSRSPRVMTPSILRLWGGLMEVFVTYKNLRDTQ